MNHYLLYAVLLTVAAILIALAGALIETGAHSARSLARARRRAARQSLRAEDEQTVTWLAGLRRPPVRALAIARARVAGLLAVLPARDGEPRCAVCRAQLGQGLCEHGAAAIRAATAAAAPLAPLPAGHPVRITIIPPELTAADLAELRARLEMELQGNWHLKPLAGPNIRAGNWQTRTQDQAPVFSDPEPCPGCERDALAAAICCCCGALPGDPHSGDLHCPGGVDPAALGRPDVTDLSDTGVMAALVGWATTAPLGEVTSRG